MPPDVRPVPEPVLYLAYAALCGERLDAGEWFALGYVAGLDGIPTREAVISAVLLKAARNGIYRTCRG